jgi:phage shock protein A
MGKMLDNFRAFWNGLGDKFSNPGALAQLNVADLEKAIRRAKDAAAPVVGRPVALRAEVQTLERSEKQLDDRIRTLLKVPDGKGVPPARDLGARLVDVRRTLAERKADLEDAQQASQEWVQKIKMLERELAQRRTKANKIQADFEAARAETKLGKTMGAVDGQLGSDKMSSLEARVNKEKARAAGYSEMSGLNSRLAEEQLLVDADVDALLAEFGFQHPDEPQTCLDDIDKLLAEMDEQETGGANVVTEE